MKFEAVAKEVSEVVAALKKSADQQKLRVPSVVNGYKTYAIGPPAQGYLVLHSVKGAALLGFERGCGMAFRVLETRPDGSQRLSAPVLVKLTKVAVGLQFGYNSVNTLVLLPGDAQLNALATDSEVIMGKDFDISGLPNVEQQNNTTVHKTSITAVSDGLRIAPTTLSVSDSLMVCDISLYGGSLGVDHEAMKEVYGEQYSGPLDVLQGKVDLPDAYKAVVGAIEKGIDGLVPRAP